MEFLLSFSSTVTKMIDWCIKNPDAFFLYSLLLNRIFAHLPIGGRGKDIIDMFVEAFMALAKRKGLKIEKDA